MNRVSTHMSKKQPLTLRERRERFMSRVNPKVIEVLLAKERTLLAWQKAALSLINTALGIAALGIAILKIFESSAYYTILFFIGMGLISVALIAFFIGYIRYLSVGKKLKTTREYRGKLDVLYFDGLNM